MPDASSPPPQPRPPSSRFTKASWAVLLGGIVLTFAAFQWAVIFRRPGEWLPGLGQAIIGTAATAVATFGFALTAFLRREPRAWAAIPPLLAGLITILYFAYNLLSKR